MILTFGRASLPSLCKSTPPAQSLSHFCTSHSGTTLSALLLPSHHSLSHLLSPLSPVPLSRFFLNLPFYSLSHSSYTIKPPLIRSLYFCILCNKFLNNNGTMGHTSNTPVRLQVTPFSGFKNLSHSQSPHFGTTSTSRHPAHRYTTLRILHDSTQHCASYMIPHSHTPSCYPTLSLQHCASYTSSHHTSRIAL